MEEIIQNPDFQEAQDLLEEYLRREFTVQINGLCTVNYQGRAKSKLDRGERLVIKKQDSALLVHGPENYQPKNWQPEVDKWNIESDGKELLLKASRGNPEEVVEIRFDDIEFITLSQMI